MADRDMTEIDTLAQRIAAAAPHMRAEIAELLRAAKNPRAATAATLPVEYVEVTRSDGTKSIMAAKDYQRLTAMDLAHTKLRIIGADEARALGIAS